jgi:hypothetical protein
VVSSSPLWTLEHKCSGVHETGSTSNNGARSFALGDQPH